MPLAALRPAARDRRRRRPGGSTLCKGRAGTETSYGAAVEAALAWQDGGAQWVHLVDLDAAFGRGTNRELISEVVGRLDVAVELSGGIRDEGSLAAALATGAFTLPEAIAAVGSAHRSA